MSSLPFSRKSARKRGTQAGLQCDVSWFWARRERGDAASHWLLSPLARHAHSHTRTLTCFPFFPTDFRGKDGLLAVYSFRSWNFLGAQAGSRLGDTREQRSRENLSATKLWSKNAWNENKAPFSLRYICLRCVIFKTNEIPKQTVWTLLLNWMQGGFLFVLSCM